MDLDTLELVEPRDIIFSVKDDGNLVMIASVRRKKIEENDKKDTKKVKVLKVLELSSNNFGQMTVIGQVKLTAMILSYPKKTEKGLQHKLVDKYFCYHSKSDQGTIIVIDLS